MIDCRVVVASAMSCLLLTACGGNSNNPAEPVPLEFVTSVASGSNNLAPLSTIEITFNRQPSASELDGLAIRWFEPSIDDRFTDKMISVTLESNGDRLAIVPDVPLDTNTQYELRIGNQLFELATENARIEREVRYNAAGDVLEYTRFDYTSRTVTDVLYEGPGNDGEWFTADDLFANRRVINFNSLGQIEREAFLSAERLERYNLYEYNSLNQLVSKQEFFEFEGRGADDQFDTDDDQPSLVERYQHDGLTTEIEVFNNPGADQQWFTSDDNLDQLVIETYTTEGDLVSVQDFLGVGNDNVIGTADDDIYRAVVTDYTVFNKPERITIFRDCGFDNACLTDDDQIEQITTLSYTDQQLSQRLLARGRGDDGLWQTDDDNLQFLQSYQYLPTGLLDLSQREIIGDYQNGENIKAYDLFDQYQYDTSGRPERITQTRLDVNASAVYITLERTYRNN